MTDDPEGAAILTPDQVARIEAASISIGPNRRVGLGVLGRSDQELRNWLETEKESFMIAASAVVGYRARLDQEIEMMDAAHAKLQATVDIYGSLDIRVSFQMISEKVRSSGWVD